MDGFSARMLSRLWFLTISVVAIAVLTHDFSDGINTMSIMLKNQARRSQALSWLIADALAPVLGIASTYFFVLPGDGFGTALALFAGFFLYIGASDLIPEVNNSGERGLTSLSVFGGVALFYGTETVLDLLNIG